VIAAITPMKVTPALAIPIMLPVLSPPLPALVEEAVGDEVKVVGLDVVLEVISDDDEVSVDAMPAPVEEKVGDEVEVVGLDVVPEAMSDADEVSLDAMLIAVLEVLVVLEDVVRAGKVL
jgi:hypothetical protein